MDSQNVLALPIKFHTPARYILQIQGILENDWSERIGGMKIIEVNSEKGITKLEGMIRDQAELIGILDSLYDLHIPIISVKSIKI